MAFANLSTEAKTIQNTFHQKIEIDDRINITNNTLTKKNQKSFF